MKRAALACNVVWITLGLAVVYPLLWMLLGSFKGSNLEVFAHPFALPGRPTLSNFAQAIREGNLGSCLLNSLLTTGLTTLLVVIMGAWTGFALSKRSFPFRRCWWALLLVGLFLPVESYVIPLLDWLQRLNIHDSLWALIFPYTAQNLPLAIVLFAAYFEALPPEVEEAARLDGVGSGRFYLTILLPLAKPAVATVAIITCLNAWNEFLLALLFIVTPGMQTLPVGMMSFQQAHNTNYPALLAGLTLISLPPLLFYITLNRQVVRGLVAGAVKE